MGLFLDPHFYSIDPYMLILHCSEYCSFVISFKIRKCETSNCIFFFLVTIVVPYESWDQLTHFWNNNNKNPAGILRGIVLNL